MDLQPLLGFHLNAPNADFGPAAQAGSLDAARNLGVQFVYAEHSWDAIEIAPGQYQWPKIDPKALRVQGIETIHGFLAPLNMHRRWQIPPDLGELAFDDPRMIERLASMLIAYVEQFDLGGRETFVVLSNESAIYFNAHPGEIGQFHDMYAQVRERVRNQFPDVKFGTTFPMGDEAGGGNLAPAVEAIRDVLDFAGFNYYAFGIRHFMGDRKFDPGTGHVAKVLDRVEQLAGGLPVFMNEIGMPTSSDLGGTEELQAQFLMEFFEEVRARTGQFVGIKWFLLYDHEPDYNRELCVRVWGNLNGAGHQKPFQEYIRTLGILRDDGTPKAAARVWQNEFRSRTNR